MLKMPNYHLKDILLNTTDFFNKLRSFEAVKILVIVWIFL